MGQVKSKNRRSGRKMSDAIFVANKATGQLTIGDKHEIDKAIWRKRHPAYTYVALYQGHTLSQKIGCIQEALQ